MKDPIIYEVTIQVREDLRDKFERFMRHAHIADVLATGHFLEARFLAAGEGRYRVLYTARDRAALDTYLFDDAARLRDDLTEHFSSGIELSREEWTVIRSWTV